MKRFAGYLLLFVPGLALPAAAVLAQAGNVTPAPREQKPTAAQAAPAESGPPPAGSVLPEPPGPRPPAQLEVVSLRVGRSEIKRPSGLAGSFITNTAEIMEVTGEARVKGRPELDEAISWQLSAPAGFVPEQNSRVFGPLLKARLVRKGGNPTGAGPYLSLTVGAKAEAEGAPLRRSVLLMQDPRDRLRQEYVDLGRSEVPEREVLLEEGQFYRRFGRRYAGVTFDELNTSRNPATGSKYPAIPLTEELVRTIHRAEKAYGRPIQVTSGFRNPVRQLEVHAEVEQSHHQYGRAADLLVPPATTRDGKRVASEADWLRIASAALAGGGSWIEPMLDCHVNTDGCHVHVDVRPGPPQSRVVTLRGKVTDPSGNPVPGATVRLAGMPAVANLEGSYQLKQVVDTDRADVTVEAPGRGVVSRAVALGGASPIILGLSVPADPNPTLLARLESGIRGAAGQATLRLVLKNTGLAEARSVKLAAGITGEALRLGQLLPTELAGISAGTEGSFNLQVSAVEPSSVELEAPLTVTANYQTPSGETRSQSFTLTARLDAAAVAAPAPPPQAVAPRTAGVILAPGRGGVDLGAAFAGLLLGAVAGVLSITLRPRPSAPADEPLAADVETAPDPAAPTGVSEADPPARLSAFVEPPGPQVADPSRDYGPPSWPAA